MSSDPFFLPNKRRAPTDQNQESPKKKSRKEQTKNEETKTKKQETNTEIVPENETADEARLRLASAYLQQLQDELSDDEQKEQALQKLLAKEALRERGIFLPNKTSENINLEQNQEPVLFLKKGHRCPVTCVALSPDNHRAYSGSKDCWINIYDLQTSKIVHSFKGGRPSKRRNRGQEVEGHKHEVLALALSSDGNILASGGKDKTIILWDTRTEKKIETFTGHRGDITALAFKSGSHLLFSGSNDRMVKVWNCDDMAYIDTLFGHQAPITGIDSLIRERAITSGSDKSLRVWKVVEETQLLFKGPKTSIDCVSMFDEKTYVTGCQDGSLQLWYNSKRKPQSSIPEAHGKNNWISSVCALKYGDLFASGSCDGWIRVWKKQAEVSSNGLLPFGKLKIDGFVNGMKFSRDGDFLLAGVGSEHRMGRWTVVRAKNGVALWKF